jgi:hypothetical protein
VNNGKADPPMIDHEILRSPEFIFPSDTTLDISRLVNQFSGPITAALECGGTVRNITGALIDIWLAVIAVAALTPHTH